MAFLYILKDEKDRYYIGSTVDISKRLIAHKSGYTQTTRNMLNPELVFSQEIPSLKLARSIEYKIKKWKRKDFIEKIIKDGYIKLLEK
ncbi:MAG: GIY-YIG nuclease family protein [Candidatus Vogelbacteria bacterium]|nr:GIY-YIG nuclease family protein [Candidatus Vogelbacteria bacterium]